MTSKLSPPWISIALISMASLAYEILLMRLFSIIQWHHFAYMVISLALLGYGVSGTFLTIYRNKLLDNYRTVFMSNLLLFGVAISSSFYASQHIQFNIEQILWDVSHFGRLLMVYLLLAIPFIFVANVIGLTLAKFPKYVSRLYGADLFGAGAGGLLIVILLYQYFPEQLVTGLSVLVLATLTVGWLELGMRRQMRLYLLLSLIIVSVLVLLPEPWTKLKISPYKGMMQSLQVTGTNIIDTKSSPLGMVHVVESKTLPFRHALGLSIKSTASIPEQIAVFFDADAMSVITNNTNNQDKTYLEQMTSSLPYHLSKISNVLILGAGGGSDVLQALHFQVESIKAVELNPDERRYRSNLSMLRKKIDSES